MKIALQLYSIKTISETAGLPAALDKAKELGYDGVEFAGLFGLTPEQAKEELDKRGLLCAGFHEGYHSIKNDINAAVQMCKICDAYSICVPHFNADSAEKWIEFAKELDGFGKIFRENGILFGFHNHVHELVALENDGGVPMDLILENCEEQNVFFEIDTRHVQLAGVSPAEYVKKYSTRVPVMHARDTDGNEDAAVGAGLVDFKAVVGACGVPEWFVVENENFGKNEEQLAESVVYLRKTFQ